MKIFFPIGSYYPAKIGGPANVMYDFINSLNSAGIKTIVATTTRGIKTGEVESNKVYDNCGNFLVYFSRFSISNLKYIYRSIRKADVVHLTSLFDIISIISYIIIVLFFSDKIVIWSPRGELSLHAMRFKSLKKKLLLKLYSFLFRRTSKLWFHSTSTLETLDIGRQFKNVRVKELPNLFLFPIENLKFIKKRQFVYVGRIHPIKSLDVLINSLKISNHFVSQDYQLIIAGYYDKEQESYFSQLNSLIEQLELKSNVKFIGHISGSEKRLLYNQSQLSFLVSKSENFGNVVVESLFEGTPVVTSTGTPWNILEDHNCGYWIYPTAENLASSIDAFIELSISDKELLYANAHEFAINNFDLNTNINKWIYFYKSQ